MKTRGPWLPEVVDTTHFYGSLRFVWGESPSITGSAFLNSVPRVINRWANKYGGVDVAMPFHVSHRFSGGAILPMSWDLLP